MTKADKDWVVHLAGWYEQELDRRSRGMLTHYQELGYLDTTPTGRIFITTAELV